MGKEFNMGKKFKQDAMNSATPSDLQTISCPECGSIYFRQVLIINKISKFITGESADQLMPVPSFRCDDCGHVPEEFRPVKPKSK